MASPKYRDYFITINEGAECWDTFKEELAQLNYTMYAYIKHDKDILETGEAKRVHYHLMVELKNPVSFDAMRKRFQGAHIESPKYKKSAYQYLIHSSPNSSEKYQYDFNEIVTNSVEGLKSIIESETFELFKENLFLRYIAQGVRTPYSFVKKFGLNAYKQYWKPYADMLQVLNEDEEMQADLKAEEQALMEELPF